MTMRVQYVHEQPPRTHIIDILDAIHRIDIKLFSVSVRAYRLTLYHVTITLSVAGVVQVVQHTVRIRG